MPFERPGPPRALDAAAARRVAGELLSRRPWTAASLMARLRRRGAMESVAAEVVAELVDRGYVDDAGFARQWVESRAGRGYGAARLRNELRARGVAPAVIAMALQRLPAAGAAERARALARRRLAALVRVPPERRWARLRDHLVRRGYAYELAAQVAREVTGVQVTDRSARRRSGPADGAMPGATEYPGPSTGR